MKRLSLVSLLLCCILSFASAAGKSVILSSPSERITAEVSLQNGKLFYSVAFDGKTVLAPMPISMTFDNGVSVGEGLRKLSPRTELRKETFEPVVRVRNARADMVWKETEFRFGRYSVIFRLYDDALAYRVVTRFREKEVKVMGEEVEYNFVHDNDLQFPEEISMYTHQERIFQALKVSEVKENAFCSHPLLANDEGLNLLISEVDLESYPGVYYQKGEGLSFKGLFPYYPAELKKTSDRDLRVAKTEDFMAKTSGSRSYPWRTVLIAEKDVDLINSNTLYSLAAPSRVEDTSWIRPGKVAWDWWNGLTLTGVDFHSDVNTRTYKYFIDFASEHGLEYVVLDEGWYDIHKTILDVVPAIDLQEIIGYGKEKNVGIILWTTWLALDEHFEEAFDKYGPMGIKGFKIDFMQRDDQVMVDWYYSTAKYAADRKLLVDYHGSYKPTGLTRTFPNVLNSEGVSGGEQNKWDTNQTPDHTLTLPFTRMALGPMDYTPGAMRNSIQGQFISRFMTPMSQGTRCHQLGMYVLYESPLQMLSDSPTNYEKEEDMMKFLSPVPTTWDESHALEGKVGDYLVMARRNGEGWWLGAMTDWTPRQVEVGLDFLEEGTDYVMTYWQDGYNVDRNAEDYTMGERKVRKGDKVLLKMAAGGGYVATFVKAE